MGLATEISLDEFVERARHWLAANAPGHENIDDSASKNAVTKNEAFRWGVGSDELELFSARTEEEEDAALDATKAWERRKFEAGYGNAVGAAARFGGLGKDDVINAWPLKRLEEFLRQGRSS